MKRLPPLILAAAMLLAGCHGSAVDRAKTTLDAGHVSTNKVAAANQAVDAHLAAIQADADAQAKIVTDMLARELDPVIRDAFVKLAGHADSIQTHATAARKETGVIATETPKVEASLDKLAEAVATATNEQKRKDERIGAFIVAVAVAGMVLLTIERATHFTFLVAAIPAVIAGAFAFALFGTVLASILGAGKVIGWCVLIAGGVAAVIYAFKRWGEHGVKGLFRNVEIPIHLTPMEKAP